MTAPHELYVRATIATLRQAVAASRDISRPGEHTHRFMVNATAIDSKGTVLTADKQGDIVCAALGFVSDRPVCPARPERS